MLLLPALLAAFALSARAQEGSIYGTVNIEGSTDWSGITVWVDNQHITKTDGYGRYQIDGLEDGPYTVSAWKENCLASVIGRVTVSGLPVVGVNGMLFAGDVVNDGRINLRDVRLLLDHLHETPDSSGWDGRLDIIHDGVIDSLDVALLALRWRWTADSNKPLWPMEVWEPGEATVWNFGQTDIPIRWYTGNFGGEVSISLYRWTGEVSVLAETTPNDGEYLLPSLPGGLETGGGYKVLVRLDEDNEAYSSPFYIENSMIVIRPDEETTWFLGERDVAVEWNPGPATGEIAILLMTYDTVVDTIARATPNDGIFDEYDVPPGLEPRGGYRVELVTADGYHVSGENFDIRNALEIYNPDSTDYWWPGSYAGINWWNRAGWTSPVSLYLYKGEEQRYTIVEGRQYDREFYDWTTPADAETGADYRVKAVYDEFPYITAFSDYFDIRPRFQVTRPSRSTTWYTGQQGIVVQWEDSGLGGTVNISLFQGTMQIDMIALGTENDGEYVDYDYIVSPDFEESGSYRVQVWYSTKFTDFSDYFHIAVPTEPPEYGWDRISPATDLRDVAVTGDNTAVAVGESGRIIRTGDGGDTWVEEESGTFQRLSAVSMSSTTTGTAVGQDGLVIRTDDGGATWIRQTPGIAASLFDISHIDDQTAVAVGAGGTVIRTVDGGLNWESLQSGVSLDLMTVCFPDRDTGWIGVKGDWNSEETTHLLRTIDGGDTWTEFDTGYGSSINRIDDIDFYDQNTGALTLYVCSVPTCACMILWTSDGGDTWDLSTWCGNEGSGFPGLSFFDASTFVYGASSFRRTTDGGATWTALPTYLFDRIYAIDSGLSGFGLAVGPSGVVLKTADYGASWLPAAAFVNDFEDVEYTGDGSAFAAGSNGLIIRSTDDGLTWEQQNGSAGGATLTSISFADADTGMVAGRSGSIFYTVDGGAGWTALSSGVTANLSGIGMTGGLTAVAVGVGGTVIQTSDGGTSWDTRVSGTLEALMAVSFGSRDHGTIVGYSGTILRTTNGGYTWTPQSSPTTANLYDVEFLDPFNGMAVGQEVMIMTSDGGENWELLPISIDGAMVSVEYSSADIITIAGHDGLILRSTDRGGSWFPQPCGTTADLRGVSFSGSLHGIIVGYDGTILRTATGGE
jgi:photosystem II stability/assembly factor-like uncharacterized protein